MFQIRMSSLIGVVTLFVVNPCMSQAVLSPPFGLSWGDSPEKLITWTSKHNLNATITQPGKQPSLRILKISSDEGFLPDTKASALEGRFLSGKLYELTVHYFDDSVPADTIAARFEKFKKQLTIEHGKFLTNQQQREVKNQFVTRTHAYHREPVKGLFMLLVYTELEDLLRKSKEAKFSLVYRNDNFRQALEADLEKRD